MSRFWPKGLPRDSWSWFTLLVAAIVATPMLAIVAQVFVPQPEIWAHLADTVLPRYLINTALLMLGVAVISLLLGVGGAWLVTMTRFPGQRVFEWAMLLPLAVPAYVMAYVYTDLLEFAGPVQTWLRNAFELAPRGYWFPNIRSLPGAILMLGLVLYPYVYMLARVAFLEQSVCVLEVSRTLGRGPWRSFFQVALPLARPAIAGGLALALMETVADFGTVQYFGVSTFTTGIYRTWFGLGEPAAAAQLAGVLMLFVAALIMLERYARSRQRYHHMSTRMRPLAPYLLKGWRAGGATTLCTVPVVFGFLLPAGLLLSMAIAEGDKALGASFWSYAGNSILAAGVTAALAVGLGLGLAYGVRLQPNRLNRSMTRIAALGYAVPGSVIAVGILLPFARFDNWIDDLAGRWFGIDTGLLLTGSVGALVFGYLVRFLAVSYNTIEASLGRVSPNMDAAARSLGSTPGATVLRVHAPLIRGGMLTAGLLVFVDVMKELPATLILRPFNFDTLAIRVYNLASDERLAEASTAALAIVAVGVIPVILLTVAIARSRPGSGMD